MAPLMSTLRPWFKRALSTETEGSSISTRTVRLSSPYEARLRRGDVFPTSRFEGRRASRAHLARLKLTLNPLGDGRVAAPRQYQALSERRTGRQ
jgi:hypothetical protein